MSAVRIKKGDTVKVIAGKDKGKTGKVMSVNAKNHTALVEGVNIISRVEFSTRKHQSISQTSLM